ncbi:MAG: hypothetical protein AB7N76_31785 [Planctomycetota bacterium]
MTACYGLGFVPHVVDRDPDDPERTTDDVLLSLRALARTAGVPVRDVVRGVAYEVDPEGKAVELPPAEALALAEAQASGRGWVPYSVLDGLIGYVVVVAGAVGEHTVYLPDGRESYVSPLAKLVARLDELLLRDDIAPSSQAVHRSLRALADVAAQLRTPLVVCA